MDGRECLKGWVAWLLLKSKSGRGGRRIPDLCPRGVFRARAAIPRRGGERAGEPQYPIFNIQFSISKGTDIAAGRRGN